MRRSILFLPSGESPRNHRMSGLAAASALLRIASCDGSAHHASTAGHHISPTAAYGVTRHMGGTLPISDQGMASDRLQKLCQGGSFSKEYGIPPKRMSVNGAGCESISMSSSYRGGPQSISRSYVQEPMLLENTRMARLMSSSGAAGRKSLDVR